jgi:hypothetical protein
VRVARFGSAGNAWRPLAVWRLVEILTEDEVSRPLRDQVAKRWPGSQAAYLLTCKRCVSVWAGLVVLILPEWLITALGWSTVTIWLNDWREARASAALTRRMAASGTVRQQGEGAEV